MLKEFREFITRGNVIDLAVGIIIGAAFTAIINSLVGDILMPIIGVIIGGVDFSAIVTTVGNDPETAAKIQWGLFMNAVVQFLIIAFAVFMLIKGINRLSRQKEEAPADAPPPAPSTDELLLQAINRLNQNLDAIVNEPKG